MQYVSLLAEQLIKEHKPDELPEGRLPPILPIVLYNGKAERISASSTSASALPVPQVNSSARGNREPERQRSYARVCPRNQTAMTCECDDPALVAKSSGYSSIGFV